MKKRKIVKKLVVGFSTTLILIFLFALPCLAVLPDDTISEPTSVQDDLYNSGISADILSDVNNGYASIDYFNSFYIRYYDLYGNGGGYVYEPFIYCITYYDGSNSYTHYLFTEHFLSYLSGHNSNIYSLNTNEMFDWFTSYNFDYTDKPVNSRLIYGSNGDVIEGQNTINAYIPDLQEFYFDFVSQYSYFFNVDSLNGTISDKNFYIASLNTQIQNLVNYQIELEDEITRLEEDYIYQYDLGFKAGQNLGYTQGLEDSNAFENGLFTIFDAPFHIIREVFSFDLFGINVASIILTIFTILIISFVIKLVL